MKRSYALQLLLLTDSQWRDPNPERRAVTAVQHALQCATRARQHDPDYDQQIVAALLHDAARPLSDVRHGEVMAEILRDRVNFNIYYALYHHGAYQHAIMHGTEFPPNGPPEAMKLAAWDANSFDPDFKNEPMKTFVPYLERVLDGL